MDRREAIGRSFFGTLFGSISRFAGVNLQTVPSSVKQSSILKLAAPATLKRFDFAIDKAQIQETVKQTLLAMKWSLPNGSFSFPFAMSECDDWNVSTTG